MDSRHTLLFLVGAALAGPGLAQDKAPPTSSARSSSPRNGTCPPKAAPPPSRTSRWWRCRSRSASISRDMIDLLNWTSLNESVRYSAGATGEAFGPDERYDWLQIRGFDPVQFIDGVQAPIGSVNNTGTDLYGSESVEVLKGPAAVLYGQSPPGGIVNMVSRRPQDGRGGELEVQGGEYNMWQVAGDLTGLDQRPHQRAHHRALPRPRDAGRFPDLEAAVHLARRQVRDRRRHRADAARELPGRRPGEPEHGLPADTGHDAAQPARQGPGRPEPRRDGLQLLQARAVERGLRLLAPLQRPRSRSSRT